MQTKIISHPLRDITIPYNEETPWSSEDDALIENYIKVHDYELQLRTEMETFMQVYTSVRQKLAGIKSELNILTDKLEKFSKKGDETFDRLIIHNFQIEENFADYGQEMMEEVNKYHDMMDEVHEEVERHDVPFNDHLDKFYNDAEWENFAKVHVNHCLNYKINSIDIVAFQKEQDDFIGWISLGADKHEADIAFCNQVAQELNVLQLETSIQYTVWNGILKRFEWARLLQERASQFGQLNLN